MHRCERFFQKIQEIVTEIASDGLSSTVKSIITTTYRLVYIPFRLSEQVERIM